ncbi:hypothetical protein ACMD2_20234 [Ananas comosus]|uniref:Uncharacterized protein n=1 Tax=Ananas comosus TaxID=4615 RepID=A0A199UIE3_ANACO|nr:hypothetical protein ACMD2_20234 [Ananas comosus]
MGTKLHGVHKLVTSLMKNESYGIVRKGSKNHPESWEIFQNIFPKTNFRIWFNHFRKDSMDRFHQQYNRELVRNTILKHEEIFRQQVHELHRLYRVQKSLMAELSGKSTNFHSISDVSNKAITDSTARFRCSTSTSETSHSSHLSNTHHSTPVQASEYSSMQQYNTIRPGLNSLCELRTYCEDPHRTNKCFSKKCFDLEQPAKEYVSTEVELTEKDQTTFSKKHLREKISTEVSEGESDIELTLSIGGLCEDHSTSKHQLQMGKESRCSKMIRPERGEERNEMSSGHNEEGSQRPPWLFQSLSLNPT